MPKKKQSALIRITTRSGGVVETTVFIGEDGRIKIPDKFVRAMREFSVCEKKKPKSK